MIVERESRGIIKLIPEYFLLFIVLSMTPTTSPSILQRGPPEFPFTNRAEYNINRVHQLRSITTAKENAELDIDNSVKRIIGAPVQSTT